MKKFLILLLLAISYTPQTFAAHYEFSLPIFIDPANNNPYLTENTNKTVVSRGEHITFDNYYQVEENPLFPIKYPNLFIKNYFCTPPLKDGKPMFDSLEIYHPLAVEANPSLISKRQFHQGKIADTNIPMFYGWQIFGNLIPERWSYQDIMCTYTPVDFSYTLSKDDTTSLRIQYPVDTPITIGNIETKIYSTYASAYQNIDGKYIVLGNGAINLFAWITDIKKVTAEKLDGTKIDITENFREENMTEGEEYLIPIDTAILHFERK